MVLKFIALKNLKIIETAQADSNIQNQLDDSKILDDILKLDVDCITVHEWNRVTEDFKGNEKNEVSGGHKDKRRSCE